MPGTFTTTKTPPLLTNSSFTTATIAFTSDDGEDSPLQQADSSSAGLFLFKHTCVRETGRDRERQAVYVIRLLFIEQNELSFLLLG